MRFIFGFPVLTHDSQVYSCARAYSLYTCRPSLAMLWNRPGWTFCLCSCGSRLLRLFWITYNSLWVWGVSLPRPANKGRFAKDCLQSADRSRGIPMLTTGSLWIQEDRVAYVSLGLFKSSNNECFVVFTWQGLRCVQFHSKYFALFCTITGATDFILNFSC